VTQFLDMIPQIASHPAECVRQFAHFIGRCSGLHAKVEPAFANRSSAWLIAGRAFRGKPIGT
jgi:hypothetical protein